MWLSALKLDIKCPSGWLSIAHSNMLLPASIVGALAFIASAAAKGLLLKPLVSHGPAATILIGSTHISVPTASSSSFSTARTSISSVNSHAALTSTTKGTKVISPTPTPTPTIPAKRAAIPACLKTVEVSCLNLAANCIDTVSYSVSLSSSFHLLEL